MTRTKPSSFWPKRLRGRATRKSRNPRSKEAEQEITNLTDQLALLKLAHQKDSKDLESVKSERDKLDLKLQDSHQRNLKMSADEEKSSKIRNQQSQEISQTQHSAEF